MIWVMEKEFTWPCFLETWEDLAMFNLMEDVFRLTGERNDFIFFDIRLSSCCGWD